MAASRSARARTASSGSPSIRSTGISARARSGSRASASVPSSAASVSLSARSARCSGCRRRRLDELRAPDDDAGLRAAEQLVAREADEVGAGGEARRGGRLVAQVEQRARAEVVDERQAVPRRDRCQLPEPGQLGEADDAEVRLVDAQKERRVGSDRALVVGRARAVGGADLDETRSRACEHVGDAEAVADLDQLAARDEHLASLGERGEGEQHRGRVVVDDERGLCAGEAPQESGEVVLARAARAGRQVVLEVGVAGAHLADALERRLGERRSAEVRVHDHARRVRDATQAGVPGGGELRE